LISVATDKLAPLKSKAASSGVDITVLGKVTAGDLTVNGENWGQVTEWKALYDNGIGNMLRNENLS